MKTSKIILGLFFLITLAVINSKAEEFTFTTTSNYISGYRAYMDAPELANKSTAIIVATPVGNTAITNPHPIGAYYNQITANQYKWSIINVDQAPMTAGLTFRVQYFLLPGPNQFVHLVTAQTPPLFNASYIDNPGLNNKPDAQVKIFPNWSPTVGTIGYNHYETAVTYDPAVGKWKIANVGGQKLETPSAFNVVITEPLITVKNSKADKTIKTKPQTRVKP
jgi:hypothetical protein